MYTRFPSRDTDIECSLLPCVVGFGVKTKLSSAKSAGSTGSVAGTAGASENVATGVEETDPCGGFSTSNTRKEGSLLLTDAKMRKRFGFAGSRHRKNSCGVSAPRP